jgi:hypothetical protein
MPKKVRDVAALAKSHPADQLTMAPPQKAKGPTYYTADDDLEPFGFKMNDIIRTPLGVAGTVIGVK